MQRYKQACVWCFLSLDLWKPLIHSGALRVSQRELKTSTMLMRMPGQRAGLPGVRLPTSLSGPTAFSLGCACSATAQPCSFSLLCFLSLEGCTPAWVRPLEPRLPFPLASKQGRALSGEQFPFLWEPYCRHSWISCGAFHRISPPPQVRVGD